uniref:Mitochondrial genome maintenance exonuclease 1-like n=1 Tax=Sinocyclocheilus grahami TaxID=75366 RepID=A0A672QH22_SINGR
MTINLICWLTLVWTVNLTLSRSQRASGISMTRDASLFKSTDTECTYIKHDLLNFVTNQEDAFKQGLRTKGIMSHRVSNTIQLQQLYGPVIRSRPPSKQPKVPKNLHPLLNEAKGQSEYVPGPLARIKLQRDSNKTSIPSVTRILQKTMPPDQAFYLERWKRRMIAELGEEGFQEYSSSRKWLNCGGLQRWITRTYSLPELREDYAILGEMATSTRRICRKIKHL